MAKMSLGLVFATLVVVVPLHYSVLCQDDDPWRSVIDEARSEASKAGFSEDSIFGAEKAIEDGSARKVAEDALAESSLDDWVKQANDMVNGGGGSAPSEAPEDAPDDEDEDNLIPDLEFAPKSAPSSSISKSPVGAPSNAPSEAPQAQTTKY